MHKRNKKKCMDFISWILLGLCIFYCEMGTIISPLILRGLKEVNMLYIALCKYYSRLLVKLRFLSYSCDGLFLCLKKNQVLQFQKQQMKIFFYLRKLIEGQHKLGLKIHQGQNIASIIYVGI